jgi:hypothetical protein
MGDYVVEPCFVYYPQFREDIRGLIDAGILTYIDENNY